MSKYIEIDSRFDILQNKLSKFDQSVIKVEPMLFNCDWEHAELLGGPITLDFLSNIPKEWKEVPCVIDTRVHMLMFGWYPCIPGWHHDDVPRTRSDNQPNYEDPHRAEHIMGLQNADVCPTKFAMGKAQFPHVPIGNTVYEQWNKEVTHCVETGELGSTHILDRELIHFTDRTWHKCESARGNGWRWFGRISRYYLEGDSVARGNTRTNEVRRQVQVYLDAVDKGW